MADGVSLDIDDTRVIATFDALPGKVHDALVTKCSALSLQLEAKIKGKLSGDVLNVQTGNLRRSIFSRVYVQGDVVHAEAGSSGDVKYAAIHEFGFKGVEHVAGFTRMKDGIAQQVRPFDREMNMPERSFIRSSLNKMRDDIVTGLQGAVREAVRP